MHRRGGHGRIDAQHPAVFRVGTLGIGYQALMDALPGHIHDHTYASLQHRLSGKPSPAQTGERLATH